jgi:sugar lactone lactonase YvrE
VVLIFFAVLFAQRGSAQQISYDDFNAAQANPSESLTNSCILGTAPAASGVLFCLNYGTASGDTDGLSFIPDNYPSTIDPNETSTTNYALQLTGLTQSQVSSLWYSTPLDVADGFDAWYAVKLTWSSQGTNSGFSNCCTADGLAFVIQNAAGGQADPISGSAETGAGFTVVGGGGGSLGYGGIDNSIALEMDTFYDSGWDPSDNGSNDDNHMALQGCGPGIANSPAHISTPNCLITLNGTSTLISNPSTSAASPATASVVTLSDGNPHQVVMTYNGPNDSPANYLYVYLDPAFNPGTHTPVAGSTPIFSGPFNIASYINLANGGASNNPAYAYIGFTAANGFNFEQHELMGFSFTPHGLQQNFGNVNVCPSGQTTPAPCNSTFPITFNFTTDTTIGSVQVVTQGTTGLDFKQGSGGDCTGTISAGNSCTVNVTFAPLAPGSRLGAVNLLDGSGNILATRLVYGVGEGPAIDFEPATQTTINTGSFALSSPKGVLVDAAGNLFISDTATQQVIKIPAHGTATTVGFGFDFPQGMAEDGAGDLFIADNNLNQIVEIPAGCTSSGCQKILVSEQTVVNGAANPPRAELGVAVDGAGDVFFDDFGNGLVAEAPANGGTPTAIYNPSGAEPVGLTADGAGNVYIADFGLKKVMEVPAGCAASSCWITVGGGWSQPDGVALDAAGDVYVADAGLDEIVEVPAGCSQVSCQGVVVSGIDTVAVAADAAGDLFVDDLFDHVVFEVNQSQPPALSFDATYVGSMSTDSPRSFTVDNIGNQALSAISPGIVINGPNFLAGLITPGDCSATFTLAPGAECNVSINFEPQSVGSPLTSTAVLTDNALNAAVATQTVGLSGVGMQPVPTTVAVPNVVGQTQSVATSTVTGASLALGTVTSAFSSTVPAGSVVSQDPAAGTQANIGSAVSIVISTGQPPAPDQLTLENNYFVTGDYSTGGVTLRGTGVGGIATGTITIPNYAQSAQGVPDGADILAAYLYWESVENTPSPSANSGTFLGYPITGQQIGSDQPYTDGALSGTLRVYRADVNTFIPVGANGIRFASGAFSVSLPDGGGSALPLTEGASLVVIYRVLSPNFPLKSVVIYDGSAIPTSATGSLTQTVEGFYDAVGGASGTGNNTNLFAGGGSWNNASSTVTLGQPDQFTETLSPGNAYAAVILSTPVNNTDNDGILDAWKAGPPSGDVHAGQPGYYDVKTGAWVGLPGALHGEKDLFVQLDYMCAALLTDGSCDFTQENLYPSPDASGNDPLAMVKQAFASSGVVLHLNIGNAVPETTCTDSPGQLCEFPNEPGVLSWDNSVQISKVWPRNFASCVSGGDCTPRFAYGQKDSYHYVLFGFSLAIPAWNTRYGTLTSIQVANGVTTIGTTDRGSGINACPSRITISGVQGNPSLNGVYNTASCADTKTITVATPGVSNWSYPNTTLPEPVIGLTSGTVTSISGYSDLGGSDSAVTLGLWETAPNQDMSKAANVIAGTLFHEIGHTLGLTHGGLYYDTPGSYIPTFEANCKPNFQSSMNYLFQLDGVGPNLTVAYSNQMLTTVTEASAGSVTQLTDPLGHAATFATSAWYVPYISGVSTASPATLHCDGTPLTGDAAYRVNGPIAPITPAWSNGQNITFDGQAYTQLRGYNDTANMDLRQVAATGGEFAALASVLSFSTSAAPLNIAAGGTVALGSGGTVALGSGGTVALGSGGNVTLGSGGTITLGSGGNITLGSGGNVTLGSGGTVTPGSSGVVALGSGGNVTLSSGGTITLGSGGTVALGSGGTVTLGSGGTIALGSGGSPITISAGDSYTIPSSGGTITLGSGGNVTLGSGGNVTLGSGGTIALGSGGTIALGSGGNVTLGSGGIIALGSGGNVTLGSGGNVTLGSGGTIALGSGGNITLGSGGNVTLGSGGTVTLGSGGALSGSGGTVALGSGGNVTLGSGGTVALGSGGTVTLGSGGNVTLGSGGTIAMGSGGTVALGSGGNVTLGSGGTITLGSGGTVTLGSGGNVTLGSGGTIALGSGGSPITIPAGGSYTIPSSGGTITLGSGGTVALGSGGNVTLGSGGTIALGSGGTIALGSGGNVTLGSGGTITMGSGGTVTLGSGGNVTLGSGGIVALGSGGNIALGSGGNVALGSGGNVTLGSGGASTDELTYQTANSIVRPPSSPTETPMMSGTTVTSVRVDWTAPAFGVVQTYTIYRSSNGATPILIGSVSGVNGFPPATTFTDTNPDLTSQTVVYTISTTLAPVTIDPTQRQSPPSPPAVLTNDQTIVLGALPSSVVLSTTSPIVTATAQTNGNPNGLEVNFSATGTPAGACSIGSQSIASGVSSATVSVTSAGSCTITASQPGASGYNAADPVSGTFAILPQGSSTQSQTITWATLPNVQYGSTFPLSASSSSTQPVSFTASGPCTASGATTGVGLCTITATAAGNNAYSAASASQSFTVFPAVLKVTATNLSIPYGQPLPTLVYTYSGFVNHDLSSVVNGAPVLSSTATAGSNSGNYPITVSTGTLATTNYSFLYVSGTLAIQPANQAALVLNTSSPLTYNQSETLSVTGGTTGGMVTYNLTAGQCTIAGAKLTANSGTGSCTVTATMAGSSNYNSVTSTPANIVNLSQVSQAISFTTNPPASEAYNSSFTVGATGGASGIALAFTSSGACSNTGTAYKMTSGTGTCSVIVNQAGNANYAAAVQVTKLVSATLLAATISISNIPTNALYNGAYTPAYSYTGNGSPSVTSSTTSVCTVSSGTVKFVGVGTCTLTASAAATTNYSAATGTAQSFTVSEAPSITSAGSATFTVGTSSPFTVTTSGFPAPSITEAGSLPGGVTFVDNHNGTGTLSGKATVSGIYPITFTASNGIGSAATQSFTLTSETTVPASGTTCNGVYIGTFSGSISVSSGQNCIFEKGGVTGSITETGGNLALSNATIGGSVQVNGGTYTIGPSTVIKSSLTVQSIPTGTTQNQICGASVSGNLTVQSVGTAATIGAGTTACAGNTISGSVTLQANKAAIGLTGNVVGGSLVDQSNTAATTLSGNTVSGSLTDQGNSAASVVSLNTITGSLVDESNSASSVLLQNTVGASLTDQGNTGATQVTGNKVTGTLLCQSNTSISGSGNTAAKKQGQCSTY